MTHDSDVGAGRVRAPTGGASRFDVTRPNLARVHNALLGGKDNYAADRRVAADVLRIMPRMPEYLRANRDMQRRAIRYIAEQAGIRQFINVGCGLPVEPHSHEIAQEAAPGSHVVYVDNDAMVVAHGSAILRRDHQTAVIHGDMTDHAGILGHPHTQRLIDLRRPVGLLLTSVLYFAEDAASIVAAFRRALAPGSHVVITHCTDDPAMNQVTELCRRQLGRGRSRSKAEIHALFSGLELVPPGLVPITEWRPDASASRLRRLHDPGPAPMLFLGGVGRLPGHTRTTPA